MHVNNTAPPDAPTTTVRLRYLLVALAMMALVAGCGGTDDVGTEDAAAGATTDTAMAEDDMDDMSSDDMATHDDTETHDDMDMAMSGSYGEPADPSEADRTVEINVDNDLMFEPNEFEAAVGEVITFRVTNTGDVEHEFVLGDEEAQQEMADMMAEGGDHAHSGEMSNAVTVHAGETGELTWRFTEPGTVLIGCHVTGHYDAGMTGTVTVN